MNFLIKYFYLIMLVVCIISFAFDFKLLQIVVIITALVIYYREYMFGNLNSYTKEQNYAAIKRVVKGFCIFMGSFAFLIISVMLFIANLKDYLIQVFFTFFFSFCCFIQSYFKKENCFYKICRVCFCTFWKKYKLFLFNSFHYHCEKKPIFVWQFDNNINSNFFFFTTCDINN